MRECRLAGYCHYAATPSPFHYGFRHDITRTCTPPLRLRCRRLILMLSLRRYAADIIFIFAMPDMPLMMPCHFRHSHEYASGQDGALLR